MLDVLYVLEIKRKLLNNVICVLEIKRKLLWIINHDLKVYFDKMDVKILDFDGVVLERATKSYQLRTYITNARVVAQEVWISSEGYVQILDGVRSINFNRFVKYNINLIW